MLAISLLEAVINRDGHRIRSIVDVMLREKQYPCHPKTLCMFGVFARELTGADHAERLDFVDRYMVPLSVDEEPEDKAFSLIKAFAAR